MKIKLTEPILDYEGKSFQQGTIIITASLIQSIEKGQKEDILQKLKLLLSAPLTFRDVFFTALNSQEEGEKLTVEQKVQMYQITKKVFSGEEPDFTLKELAFIQERVEKIYILPLIVGRVKEVFETNKDINNF